MADAILKRCCTCKQELPLSSFSPAKATKDGLRKRCKPCNNKGNAEYRLRHPEESKRATRNWALKNPAKAEAKRARWNAAHPGRQTELVAAWRKANPEKNAATLNKSRKKRRSRIAVQLHDRIGSQIRYALKSAKKAKTFDIVGYSVNDLKEHLERQFLPRMSWSNFGEWHIDHIVPISAFIVEDEGAAREVWALPNLRPLWAKDNLSKHAKRTHLI